MDIPELIELYDQQHDRIDALKAELKEAQAEFEATEAQLYGLMSQSGFESLKHSGKTYALKDTTFFSIPAEMQEEFMDRLEANGFGSLIKRTVNQRTFSAFANEQRNENGGVLPEMFDGVRSYTKFEISRIKA